MAVPVRRLFDLGGLKCPAGTMTGPWMNGKEALGQLLLNARLKRN